MDFESAQVRERAAANNKEVDTVLVQLLEGVVDSAVERFVGLPQGLAVADNNEVELVVAQALVQPADDSRAEVRSGGRKQKSYCRNTEVDRRVHGNGVDVAFEHTSWLLRTVMYPAKVQGQGEDGLWKMAEASKRDGQ